MNKKIKDHRSVFEDLGLREGQSIELLKELHILTREGRINQDSRRKLKQVNHLTQLLGAPIQEIVQQKSKDVELHKVTKQGANHSMHHSSQHSQPVLSLADHGAGKSYLGFILYDALVKGKLDLGSADSNAKVFGIETRAELVSASKELAQRLGFAGMVFLNTSARAATQDPQLPERIDVVTALHACDSATDDAIEFGLEKRTSLMALVPCCQAETAAQLRRNKAFTLTKTPLSELWRHPVHTREFGSQVTNVMRCLYLESQGYSVSVTELVGWEHSMKNELILARYTGHKKQSALARLHALLVEFGLESLGKLRYPRATMSDSAQGA